jgi:hypothetical protein
MVDPFSSNQCRRKEILREEEFMSGVLLDKKESELIVVWRGHT